MRFLTAVRQLEEDLSIKRIGRERKSPDVDS